jgi:hypothetical protein
LIEEFERPRRRRVYARPVRESRYSSVQRGAGGGRLCDRLAVRELGVHEVVRGGAVDLVDA